MLTGDLRAIYKIHTIPISKADTSVFLDFQLAFPPVILYEDGQRKNHPPRFPSLPMTSRNN
jgi:hypothetical protein